MKPLKTLMYVYYIAVVTLALCTMVYLVVVMVMSGALCDSLGGMRSGSGDEVCGPAVTPRCQTFYQSAS